MTSIDTPTLVNWIVSGFIGLCFGIISAWVTYRYERKRDDIAWEREKERLQQQFEHERKLVALEFQQKLEELTQEKLQEQNSQIRSDILKGVENSAKTLEELERTRAEFAPQRAKMRVEQWRTGYSFLWMHLFTFGVGLIVISSVAFPQGSPGFVTLVGVGIFMVLSGISFALFRMLLRKPAIKELNDTVQKSEKR